MLIKRAFKALSYQQLSYAFANFKDFKDKNRTGVFKQVKDKDTKSSENTNQQDNHKHSNYFKAKNQNQANKKLEENAKRKDHKKIDNVESDKNEFPDVDIESFGTKRQQDHENNKNSSIFFAKTSGKPLTQDEDQPSSQQPSKKRVNSKQTENYKQSAFQEELNLDLFRKCLKSRTAFKIKIIENTTQFLLKLVSEKNLSEAVNLCKAFASEFQQEERKKVEKYLFKIVIKQDANFFVNLIQKLEYKVQFLDEEYVNMIINRFILQDQTEDLNQFLDLLVASTRNVDKKQLHKDQQRQAIIAKQKQTLTKYLKLIEHSWNSQIQMQLEQQINKYISLPESEFKQALSSKKFNHLKSQVIDKYFENSNKFQNLQQLKQLLKSQNSKRQVIYEILGQLLETSEAATLRAEQERKIQQIFDKNLTSTLHKKYQKTNSFQNKNKKIETANINKMNEISKLFANEELQEKIYRLEKDLADQELKSTKYEKKIIMTSEQKRFIEEIEKAEKQFEYFKQNVTVLKSINLNHLDDFFIREEKDQIFSHVEKCQILQKISIICKILKFNHNKEFEHERSKSKQKALKQEALKETPLWFVSLTKLVLRNQIHNAEFVEIFQFLNTNNYLLSFYSNNLFFQCLGWLYFGKNTEKATLDFISIAEKMLESSNYGLLFKFRDLLVGYSSKNKTFPLLITEAVAKCYQNTFKRENLLLLLVITEVGKAANYYQFWNHYIEYSDFFNKKIRNDLSEVKINNYLEECIVCLPKESRFSSRINEVKDKTVKFSTRVKAHIKLGNKLTAFHLIDKEILNNSAAAKTRRILFHVLNEFVKEQEVPEVSNNKYYFGIKAFVYSLSREYLLDIHKKLMDFSFMVADFLPKDQEVKFCFWQSALQMERADQILRMQANGKLAQMAQMAPIQVGPNSRENYNWKIRFPEFKVDPALQFGASDMAEQNKAQQTAQNKAQQTTQNILEASQENEQVLSGQTGENVQAMQAGQTVQTVQVVDQAQVQQVAAAQVAHQEIVAHQNLAAKEQTAVEENSEAKGVEGAEGVEGVEGIEGAEGEKIQQKQEEIQLNTQQTETLGNTSNSQQQKVQQVVASESTIQIDNKAGTPELTTAAVDQNIDGSNKKPKSSRKIDKSAYKIKYEVKEIIQKYENTEKKQFEIEQPKSEAVENTISSQNQFYLEGFQFEDIRNKKSKSLTAADLKVNKSRILYKNVQSRELRNRLEEFSTEFQSTAEITSYYEKEFTEGKMLFQENERPVGFNLQMQYAYVNQFIKPIIQLDYKTQKEMIKYRINVESLIEEGKTLDHYELNKKLRLYEANLSETNIRLAQAFDIWQFDFSQNQFDQFRARVLEMKVFDGTPKNPELDFKNVEIENSIDEEFVFDVNLVEELIIKRQKWFREAERVVRLESNPLVDDLIKWGVQNDEPMGIYLGEKIAMGTNQVIPHDIALLVSDYLSYRRNIPESRIQECKKCLEIVGKIDREIIYDFNKDYHHIFIRNGFKRYIMNRYQNQLKENQTLMNLSRYNPQQMLVSNEYREIFESAKKGKLSLHPELN